LSTPFSTVVFFFSITGWYSYCQFHNYGKYYAAVYTQRSDELSATCLLPRPEPMASFGLLISRLEPAYKAQVDNQSSRRGGAPFPTSVCTDALATWHG
jgi:hypothetical protein